MSILERASTTSSISPPSAPGLVVVWNIEPNARTRRQARPRSSSTNGNVIDVTPVGAAIIAPADEGLTAGCSVVIGYGSTLCAAVIRRVVATDRAAHSVYGVTFVDPPEQMIEHLVIHAAAAGIDRRIHLWS